MTSSLEQKLYVILQEAVQSGQLEQAEQAITHLKALKQVEDFADGEAGEDSAAATLEKDMPGQEEWSEDQAGYTSPVSWSTEVTPQPVKKVSHPHFEKKETPMFLYYLQEENVLKFKKNPQSYSVSVDFFVSFLENLKKWENETPFSSKDYYGAFSEELRAYTSYQSSTLRQFITLLFRYCYKMGLIIKPEPPQRNLYYVKQSIDPDDIIAEIKSKKILQF